MHIILDAGHCKSTSGKRSPDGTLLEYELNYDIANRIKTILENHGVKVTMIDCEDRNMNRELRELTRQANEIKDADALVSIHSNAAYDGSKWFDGNYWVIFCYNPNDKNSNGYKLAKSIEKATIPLGVPSNGVWNGSKLWMIKATNVPAVLVEHSFYDNKEWCEKLKTNEWRQKFAEADAKGILDYLNIPYNTPAPTKDVLYTVQVGAFTNIENAKALSVKLLADGYHSFITEKSV